MANVWLGLKNATPKSITRPMKKKLKRIPPCGTNCKREVFFVRVNKGLRIETESGDSYWIGKQERF